MTPDAGPAQLEQKTNTRSTAEQRTTIRAAEHSSSEHAERIRPNEKTTATERTSASPPPPSTELEEYLQ